MIQWMLAIWSLFPLPFLNSVCTSGISRFTYYWSVAWRILSITVLACEMNVHVQLNIFWRCLSLVLEWKLTFSSPVATAEFSKFVVIHTVKGFSQVHEAEIDAFCFLFFSRLPLLSPWSSECWKLDFWFLWLFKTQISQLEVLSSHCAEAYLEEFWALPC